MRRFLSTVLVLAFVSTACAAVADDFKVLKEITVPFAQFVQPGMIVNQDGSQVVYTVVKTTLTDNEYVVRVNDTPLGNLLLALAKYAHEKGDTKMPTDAESYRCSLVSNVTVDPKWQEVAYTILTPTDNVFLLRNQLTSEDCPAILPAFGIYPSYSPCTGKKAKLAYFSRDRDGRILVFGGRHLALEEDSIPVSPAVFSRDGARAAYVTKKMSRCSLFVNENRVLSDQDSIEPAFNPKGNGICYIACKGKTSVLVVDGKTQECEFPPKHSLTFAPKGDVYAYVTKSDTGESVVKKGSRIPKEFKSISSPAFDPTGARLAYVARGKDTECVMIDDRKVTPDYNQVTFNREAFETKGTLVFAGYDENKGMITVGKIEPPSKAVASTPK